MIRNFRLEDINYIINSHYEIYNQEYDYDLSFKEFIANSLEDFIKRSDYLKENIWIAEINGEPKGSICITKFDESTAQIRLFIVDPKQRGTGIGKQLIEKSIDFCKLVNYKTITLWTNSDLKAARSLYENYGFKLMETKKVILSNQNLIEERWELNIF